MLFKRNYVTDWTLISKTRSSKAREPVLLALTMPTTPTQLSKKLKLEKSQVTRALAFLVEHKLAVSLTPDVRKHKLFQRTSAGEKLAADLESLPR